MVRIIPIKRIREEFHLIYELKGAQNAVNYLSNYYKTYKMKIIVNGRKVGKGNLVCYLNNKSYFKKRTFNKTNILHEFYHHLIAKRKIIIENEES